MTFDGIGGQIQAQKLTNRRHHVFRLIGFANKSSVFRELVLVGRDKTRREKYVNWRPTTPNCTREPQTVQSSRHIDVCENGANIASILKNFNGGVRIAGLNHYKPSVFQHLDRAHPNERFVLDDQDNLICDHVIYAPDSRR
jgi:hypothetical protein